MVFGFMEVSGTSALEAAIRCDDLMPSWFQIRLLAAFCPERCQMLEWATAGAGPHFAMIIHHDDADRGFAYDRESRIGRLAREA
jgi:hypothetical protein